jgi:hypothetical protein
MTKIKMRLKSKLIKTILKKMKKVWIKILMVSLTMMETINKLEIQMMLLIRNSNKI